MQEPIYWPAWQIILRRAILMAAPSILFLGTLTAMLLRHPDVAFYEIDRVAFGLLVIGIAGRAVVLRQRLFVMERVTWPMLGLTLLAIASWVASLRQRNLESARVEVHRAVNPLPSRGAGVHGRKTVSAV